jgi:voltage-gated potassium channel
MKDKIWQTLIFILSLYVLIELAIEIIYPFSDHVINIINTVDFFICLIFLIDFFYFMWKSENKLKYLRGHWIDFIASIPFMTFFRVFRIARVFRIIRLFRGTKALIHIVRILGTNKLQNILISYIIILILVLGYCSLAFYTLEKGVNPNIKTYFDAVWWGFITITTVGYGDIFPTTTGGRIVSMVLALAGMGLFSIVTAELAAKFYRISQNQNTNEK